MDEPKPLTYEETPIIDPNKVEEVAEAVPEATRVFHPEKTEEPPQPSLHPPKPTKKCSFHVGTLLFIVLLFGLGIWLSNQMRSFFAPSTGQEFPVPTLFPFDDAVPTYTPNATPSGASVSGTWQTYQIISGSTKRAIDGVSYQLPPEVNAPVCDSASCSSSGTNLSGGTRFTVAPRGKGQLLPDFRGAILTDAAGREFVMKQSTVGGQSVYEYTGDFIGRTGGGYTFTNMRGVLVPVSDTFAVEFNHFSPLGITTDFEKDDVLFDKIVTSFTASDSATGR